MTHQIFIRRANEEMIREHAEKNRLTFGGALNALLESISAGSKPVEPRKTQPTKPEKASKPIHAEKPEELDKVDLWLQVRREREAELKAEKEK